MSNKVSNAKARSLVQARRDFKGANTFGLTLTNGIYAVYSYGTHWPLFAYKDNVWYANTDKYSTTTSKHYTQLHPHTEVVPVGVHSLKQIINQ